MQTVNELSQDQGKPAAMPQVVNKLTDELRPDPKQPRQAEVDDIIVDQLGDDLLRRGVLVPPLITVLGIIVDGFLRRCAAKRKGIKQLPCIVIDENATESEIRGIQLATFFHRTDLVPYDKYKSTSDLLIMNPQWTQKDLSQFLNIDPSSVPIFLSPSKCIPAWVEALKESKVGLRDCRAASLLSEEDQASLLAFRLSGASCEQTEREGRKKRNGQAPAVRMSRVKIPLVGGTIVISGNELDMTSVVDLLSESLKEAKKAADQFDVKTFQAMMKDKAGGK